MRSISTLLNLVNQVHTLATASQTSILLPSHSLRTTSLRLLAMTTTCGTNDATINNTIPVSAAAINKDPPKPKPSFYKRPLPESCIALSSAEGKKIFASALANNGLKTFFPLIEQFTTQSEPAYCGISTLVLVLNALAVDPRQNWKGPWRWYHESMLNCCIDLEEIKKTGITLKDFQCLAHCQGLTVDLQYCDAATSLEDFRKAVQVACVEQDPNDDEDESLMEPMAVLVVSYSRKVLGQTGTGHFSPIGGYDPVSDKVLILDTARFKYGAHWVDLPVAFEAMQPIDPDTSKPRGFSLLSFRPVELDSASNSTPCSICGSSQPLSLMFRTKMSASPYRRQYKGFLTNQSSANGLTWERVYDYWTKNDPDNVDVWKIMEPLVLPTDCSQASEDVANMKALLDDLIALQASTENSKKSCSGPSGSCHGAPCVSTKDAIFVVYLASLDEDERKKVVEEASSHSKRSMELLLNEAALVAAAIDVSDQLSM